MNGSPQLVSNGTNDGATRSKWKSMITNASFRTRKLPDDITVGQLTNSSETPVAPHTHSVAAPAVHLGSITEENDEPSIGKSFRLSELVKKKNKPKDKSKLKVNNNGGIPSDVTGSNPHTYSSSENNGVVLNAVTPADWNSDAEDEMELRRRSNELNGSTPV